LKLIVNPVEPSPPPAVLERVEQALGVVRGFDQISDPALQKAVLHLIEALAAASRAGL
jgi:hypothetical protein